jgi:hypothetical protein
VRFGALASVPAVLAAAVPPAPAYMPGAVGNGSSESSAGYLAMPTMWSTAAFTKSSDRSARPPLAGITPELP